ncbi:MAG: RNA 3'-terminal phosphate cyclase, partial [Candidatus Thorarchaeota archaeon]|nr:RNA 3'-terminal phosphate cyclase [Candidatus Thorarchaeota archaeon]
LSPEPVSFRLRGGTDVAWSPPIDYMRNLFVNVLHQMGPRVEIVQHRRGHYPRGGGDVSCEIIPVKTIEPLDLVQFGELQYVNGISHCVRLPSHVAERQASSAESILAEHNIETEHIVLESYPKSKDSHLGPGSGIVIWAESRDGIRLGADRLGERGKRAELVGAESAQHLLSELSTEMAIDSHLSDMLVPYLAIATGRSRIGVTKLTSHLETNIWVVERILGLKMMLEGKIGSPGILTSEGIGLSSGE